MSYYASVELVSIRRQIDHPGGASFRLARDVRLFHSREIPMVKVQ